MIVLAAALIYFIRVCFTTLFLLRRRMGWPEAITIVVWVGIIHVGFAILTLSTQQPLDSLDLTSGALYLLGSYLNTGSEYERYRGKQIPENQGHPYTEGLFRYSMHINYFGDTLLFTGYALLTRHLLAFIVPLLMAGIFVFGNIPMLDRYLHERYGEEFSDYARRTKKFIPFLY